MDQLPNIVSLQDFVTICNDMTDSKQDELCLQIIKTIAISSNIETVTVYCNCLIHRPATLDSLFTNATNDCIQCMQIMIRNQNVNVLQTFLKFASKSKITDILGMAYSSLNSSHINYSFTSEMDVFVQSYLITSQFYAAKEELPMAKKTNLKEIADKKIAARFEYLITLTRKFLEHKDSKVDTAFRFDLKQVIINIFMMKNTLPATKRVIPWLELEFYCIQFLRYYTADNVTNLFSYGVISKEKLSIYLNCFLVLLIAEANRPQQNRKKQPAVASNDRETLMNEIVANTPEFAQLASDYNFLRDLHSMHRIGEVVAVARAADPETNVGRIVIVRALQVLGEHTKSTAATAKMSSKLERRLLDILPLDMLEVVQKLRDNVSHSAGVRHVIPSEKFERMQRQLGFVGDAVRYATSVCGHMFANRVIEALQTSDENIPALRAHFERNSMAFSEINLNKRNDFVNHYEGKFQIGEMNTYAMDSYTVILARLVQVLQNDDAVVRSHIRNFLNYFDKLFYPKSLNLDGLFKYANMLNCDSDEQRSLVTDLTFNQIPPRTLRDTIQELATVLNGYTYQNFQNDDVLCAAVELLLLEIFSLLEEQKLLTNAHQWLDAPMPVLAGKPFRNHLAHYNALVDILTISQRVAVFQNAQLFIAQLDGAHVRPTCFEPSYEVPDLEQLVADLRSYVISAGESDLVSKYPLHDAVQLGDIDLIQRALAQQHSVNELNNFGASPLHIAAGKGRLDIVRLLLRHGADRHLYDKRGFFPLHTAVIGNHKHVVEEFLQREDNAIAAKTKDGRTCLHLAAEFSFEMTQKLIDKGADVKAVCAMGSVLQFATGSQDHNIIPFLLCNGAQRDESELSRCLHFAVILGLSENARVLLDEGANVNWCFLNKPILHLAIIHNKEVAAFELSKLLITRGSVIHAPNYLHETALHQAARFNYPSVIQLLIENGALIDVLSTEGQLPLHYACKHGDLDSVKMLFTKEIVTDWVKVVDVAIRYSSVKVVDYLLSSLSDVCNIDLDGIHALETAITREDKDDLEILQYLLSSSKLIDIDITLLFCFEFNNYKAYQLILQTVCSRDNAKYVSCIRDYTCAVFSSDNMVVPLNFDKVFKVMHDKFVCTQDTSNLLKLYKLAMIQLRCAKSSLFKSAKPLSKKIHDLLMQQNTQKELIYKCVWFKTSPARREQPVQIIEDFFIKHAPLNYDSFHQCVAITILPNSAMKRSEYFEPYLEQCFLVMWAKMEAQAALKKGNVIAAQGFALAGQGIIRMSKFDLKQVVAIDFEVIRRDALKIGFTETQIATNFKYVLHDAVECDDMSMLLRGLEFGVNANQHDLNNRRPIDCARFKGLEDMVMVLLRHSLVQTIDRMQVSSVANEVRFAKNCIAKDG